MYYYEEEYKKIEKYSLDNFVVTNNNKLVFNALKHINDNIKNKIEYNPLFITGYSGCGKTHILQGFANQFKIDNPKIKLLYINMDNFIIDIIESFKNNKQNNIDNIEKIKNFYKQLDVLIIDDFHIIENKKSSQNIFFEIFNFLQSNNKKIIISSKYTIDELKSFNKDENETFNERLLSRLQWGLNVEFQEYDYESIIAILVKKTESYNFNMDIINYIAENIYSSNIRELEGIITKLIALSVSINKDIDEKIVKNFLKENKKSYNKSISIDNIIEVISKYFKLSKKQIKSKNRTKTYTRARDLAIWFSTKYSDMSLETIGNVFSGRDHSSIIYSRNKVDKLLKTDETTKKIVDNLKKILINY